MDDWQRLGVGSNPPPYILDGSALKALHPDGPEQHGVEGWSADTNGWQHCLSPKCGHMWTPEERQQLDAGGVACPECGHYVSRDKLERMGQEGGGTKSGLTLAQMGSIAEEVVNRMGEMPGIGPITWRAPGYHSPVDLTVTSQQDGVEYGCEVKSQHSQGKGYFWAGSPSDVKATLAYCMQHGLKPALVGVRLNFFNDKANIFFRPGLSNTWIGNDKMQHVATVDFSDLNPFKTPEQKDALLQSGPIDENGRVDTNHPDYDFEKDLDSMFGPAGIPGAIAKTAWDEQNHPRDAEGKFVAKKAIHELEVLGRNGKHMYTIKRCQHCGFTYKRDKDHLGRMQCPTCGDDPERKLRLTKVVIGRDPVRDMILRNSWSYMRRTANGHHAYGWTGPNGVKHTIVTGNTAQKAHSNLALEADQAQKRMNQCMAGECNHAAYVPEEVEEGALAGTPLIKAGQEVSYGPGKYWVQKVNGDVATIYDEGYRLQDVNVHDLQVASALKQADYNGWSNWDTWHASLMMDNERETSQQARQFAQQGNKQAFINWVIEAILGPYNKQQIADAKEWNSIPPEERIDHGYEDMRDKSPAAADLWDNLMGGPDVGDEQPRLMDPDLINWDEIWNHLLNEIEEERRHEQGLPPTWKDIKPNPDEPGDMTLPEAWSKTADADPEYMFVSYMNKLVVEPWHHNLRALDLVERMLTEIGYDLSVQDDIDPADVVIGVIRDDKARIDSATRPEANEMALDALRTWQTGKDADGWQTLREAPEEWQPL